MSSRIAHKPTGVRLADVLHTTLPPTADVYATGATEDPGAVRPGDVYFAADAEASTAMRGAEQAIAAGACAVVASQWLPISGAPQYVVADPRASFAGFCHAVVGLPAESIAITAVAGRHGKSAVVRLLDSIYQAAGEEVATTDGLHWKDGCRTRYYKPTAAITASWLAESVANGLRRAVAEIHPGADKAFTATEFNAVCVTNLPTDRRGPSDSVESHRTAVAAPLARLAQDGLLVTSADDPACSRLLAGHTGPALTFGVNSAADVTGRVVEQHTGGQVFVLRCGADSVAVSTRTIGEAHLANCLAAATLAIAAGVPLSVVARGLESAPGASLRMQTVACGQDFSVCLDAASDSRSVAMAARSVAAVASGKLHTVVVGDGGPVRASLIASASAASDQVIGVGATRQNATERVAGVRIVEDAFAGVALALATAEAGDAVLVVGCRDPRDGEPSAEEIAVRQLIELRLANEQPLAAAG